MAMESLIFAPGRATRKLVGPKQKMREIVRNNLRISSFNRKSGTNGNPSFAFAIGANLLKKLDWKPGDRVDVLVDKEDRLSCIRLNPEGITLSKPSSSSNFVSARLTGTGWQLAAEKSPVVVSGVQIIENFSGARELLFDLPAEISVATD